MSFPRGPVLVFSTGFVSMKILQTKKCFSFFREFSFRAASDTPAVADDYGGFFRAGYGSVEDVAVVHEGLGFVDDCDDAFAFGALHFVDCRGEGERDVFHVVVVEFPDAVVELDVMDAAGGVDALDAADRAVHDVVLVIVPVHYLLVVDMKLRTPACATADRPPGGNGRDGSPCR